MAEDDGRGRCRGVCWHKGQCGHQSAGLCCPLLPGQHSRTYKPSRQPTRAVSQTALITTWSSTHWVSIVLVSIAGPIAITSANPSGEPDSTHHDMVINTLGKYCPGQYTGPIVIISANPSGEPDSTHHDTVIDTLGKYCHGQYTGRIAITSANPSGEPDSTHHDTVIDTLGKSCHGQYTGPIVIMSANPSGEPDSNHHDTVIDTLGKYCPGQHSRAYSHHVSQTRAASRTAPITTWSSTHWVSIALVSIAGPIAITSANPSGECDSYYQTVNDTCTLKPLLIQLLILDESNYLSSKIFACWQTSSQLNNPQSE